MSFQRVGGGYTQVSWILKPQVIEDRSVLENWYEQALNENGTTPKRPSFWGGFRINPVEIEFWADGEARLHDRFRWTRTQNENEWSIDRLSP